MSELVAEGVAKSFPMADGALDVLLGVDLRVAPGESVAVLGVSGAGKSTLLHILGGLERPTRGRVLYGGIDVYGYSSAELAQHRSRNLGFVFQLHHLLPEFTAEENVMLPCMLAGWSRGEARDRARELLEAVGLSARRLHSPGKLSGGERQRVAIARSLALSPPILLADEPTGNLDPQTAERVEETLLRLNAEAGTALILVTHNEKLAGQLDKKIYLASGRLES